jgi:predicted RNA-binding protein YlxR (DUF448 family)
VTEPERQCIGCGRRAPQSGFLRLTLDQRAAPARVTVAGDSRVRRGRGAYLCRRRACLDRALHRKAFQRAFRASLVVDADEIAALLMVEAGE